MATNTDDQTPLLHGVDGSGNSSNDDAYQATNSAGPIQCPEPPTSHPMRARLQFIFPALATGIFLSAADQTIVVSSYGRIGSDLSGLEKAPWLATAYLITNTAFQPLYGKLSDIVGRKPCLLF